MIWIAATLLCGVLGAYIGYRLKIPAGVMIGAMAGSAIFSICSGQGVMPGQVKVMTQAVTGIFIGMKIQKKDLPTLKRIFLPAVCSALLMSALCVGMGMLLASFSKLDTATAVLGCAPGGIADILRSDKCRNIRKRLQFFAEFWQGKWPTSPCT